MAGNQRFRACPGRGGSCVHEGVEQPDSVLEDGDGDVCRHVVFVVKDDEGEVAYVEQVGEDTRQRPDADGARAAVEAEQAQRGIKERVEHVGAGAEVVHAFGEGKVSRVEDTAPDPGVDAEQGEEEVEGPERVAVRERGEQAQAVVVHEAVSQREQDGEGLLDAHDAVEGPFAVELLERGAPGDELAGDGVLARIVALCGTRPEQQAQMQRRRRSIAAVLGDAGADAVSARISTAGSGGDA
ncbi:hypothetical protein NEOLI_004275 [Neolecta irregularis DAH-3]|uniref:Uncharacterized protein n=1 Tax=Neolecta irregularis (strain DAH-3) TaxID=1198029 RepID=A0A1U7LLX7_NEOID|nr:hypothetical protein NEOLI_004275 [Neolecta irregularis DAH-3]|eukprot:OLL23664.1 hypothetical protein NEOLI_004275 [Neolecta irregularis DAH-3]